MIHENSGRVAVIEDQVDIERPPEEVFDYCSDHTNEREWNIRTRRVEKLTDGPVGSTGFWGWRRRCCAAGCDQSWSATSPPSRPGSRGRPTWGDMTAWGVP
jgi:hypothetical protein